MTMGYFERTKLLKKANTLDLTPVHKIDFEQSDEGLITLLVPKFKNARIQKFMVPKSRSSVIRIRLDLNGSELWKAINGKDSIMEICSVIQGNKDENDNNFDVRASKFIFKLYQERYITFKEIEQ
jgi:DNA-binding LytR/AlgR family response regulator